MANKEYLDLLKKGTEAWNHWRFENLQLQPDFSGANLSGIDLQRRYLGNVTFSGANLTGARFYEANLSGSNLSMADLRGADLSRTDLSSANLTGANLSGGQTNLWHVVCNGTDFSGANLSGANLYEAFISQGARLIGTDLSKADLSEAYLCGAVLKGANLSRTNLNKANLSDDFGPVDISEANLVEADLGWADLTGANLTNTDLTGAYLGWSNLTKANLSGAHLTGANLEISQMVETNLINTELSGSRIYGVSAWNLQLSAETIQLNLIITREDEPVVTADSLEVAQFIYLLLNNEKIRKVIDTMTSKAVLILGNFSDERKVVLEEIRTQLRERNYLPILFDFEGPKNKSLTDAVTTVARLSRFVIVDITQPRSVPAELEAIVPALPTVPVQPLIEASEEPYAMFRDLVVRDTVLKLHRYTTLHDLLASFDEAIVDPALKMRDELEVRRLRAIEEKL
jgi:uncharacterized protein YjbI with pentapeptide repeats